MNSPSIEEVNSVCSSQSNRSSPWTVVLLIVAFAGILWVERYRFDSMVLENGESYPVRISRLTGESQVLYRGVWKPTSEIQALAPRLEDLGPGDVKKLAGEGRLDWDGIFDLKLYNGSDFALKEITLEMSVKDSHGDEVLRQAYQIEARHHGPKETFHHIKSLSFHVGPQQSWAWRIVGAKGVRY